MYHYVGAELDWPHKIGCGKCVVDNKRYAVTVSRLRYGLYVDDVRIRISERFYEYRLGRGSYRLLKVADIARVDKCRRHPVGGQCVVEKIVAASVDCLGRYDVVAAARYVEQRVGYCGGSAGHSQCGNTAFKCGDALFKYLLGAVGEPAVDIACVLKGKPRLGLRRIFKYVGCRLIYRYCACAC